MALVDNILHFRPAGVMDIIGDGPISPPFRPAPAAVFADAAPPAPAAPVRADGPVRVTFTLDARAQPQGRYTATHDAPPIVPFVRALVCDALGLAPADARIARQPDGSACVRMAGDALARPLAYVHGLPADVLEAARRVVQHELEQQAERAARGGC